MNADSMPPEQDEFRLGPIGQFAIKTGIVTVACFLFFVLAVMYLDSIVEARVEQFRSVVQQVQSATKIGGREFWSKLERELENQASPAADLPAAKKQKILNEIRVVSDRWRPFVKETLSAITGETEKPPAR